MGFDGRFFLFVVEFDGPRIADATLAAHYTGRCQK